MNRRVSKTALKETRAEGYFSLYFALGGDRSLKRLHSELGKLGVSVSMNTLFSYSSEFHWQDRLVQLQKKAEEEADRDRVGQVLQMNERQGRLGRAMQAMAGQGLTSLDPKAMKATDVAFLAQSGVKVERLALGEATERGEFVIKTLNIFVREAVAIFIRANSEENPERRKALFAAGMDGMMEQRLKAEGLLSAGNVAPSA